MNNRPPGPVVPDHMTVNQYRWTVLQDPQLQATLNPRRVGRALAARSREMGIPVVEHPLTRDNAYHDDVWQSVLARDGGRYFDAPGVADNARLAQLEAQVQVLTGLVAKLQNDVSELECRTAPREARS